MSEITKLYENAGVSRCPAIIPSSGEVLYWKGYPPFTAEKQIELIKVIANRECFVANYVPKRNIFILSSEDYCGTQINFSDALAELINNLWQDLTEEEKQQVKGILES